MFEFKAKNNYFKLPVYIDYIIRHKILSGELSYNSKLPFIKELSDTYNFSERVVKEAYKRLSDKKLIKISKKSGANVSYKNNIKLKKSYNQSFIYFKNILQELYSAGFDNDDIFACFYNAFISLKPSIPEVIFVEDNVFDLIQGKEELEKILNYSVYPLLTDIFYTKSDSFKDSIIITSFRNYFKLIESCKNFKIFPLKTTPPLSELINFDKIPSNSVIIYIATSDENKKILIDSYNYLKKTFPNFKIITIEEYNQNMNPELIITTKKILEIVKINNKCKIITVKRFYDSEGINIIKSNLQERNK